MHAPYEVSDMIQLLRDHPDLARELADLLIDVRIEKYLKKRGKGGKK